MNGMAQIQPFVQEYAETISEVLDVDVTIVDEACVRIGGTGPYKQNIGQVVPHGSFFRKVLETGKPGIIYDQSSDLECKNCTTASFCQELATMGFPIFKWEKPIGVIGIMAFTPEQKTKLVETSSKLLGFLNHMSSLLESKLILLESNQRLQHQVEEAMGVVNKNFSFGTMIGSGPALNRLVMKAKQVAPGSSTVLIRGESGTGKELLARAIHSESNRSQFPFVIVNCPSIPENLLESELFGYEGGAFTGANKQGKLGKFELAHQGTIFLDEIGDLPSSLQPKLLRVLQEKTIDRVGGKKPIPIDVRVIAATNKDLETMVKNGSFREDLYYRLNVIPLFVPPLRERREDIPLYFQHFLAKYGEQLNKENLRIDPELIEWLRDYPWPGNVRELENVAEYMVNMSREQVVSIRDLPYQLIKNRNSEVIQKDGLSLEERVADYEKSLLKNLLIKESTLEDKKRVAQELKISLATLYRKLDKYGL